MVALISMYLVYFYVKQRFQWKRCVKITFIIISISDSFAKSDPNGIFCTNIIIIDPLDAKKIKTLPLTMYFYSAIDRFYGIYKQAVFTFKIRLFEKIDILFIFALLNIGWISSIWMSLLINNVISTCFIVKRMIGTRINGKFYVFFQG
eukprot:129725_1